MNSDMAYGVLMNTNQNSSSKNVKHWEILGLGSWDRGALCGFQRRQYCLTVHLMPRQAVDYSSWSMRGEGLAESEVRLQGSRDRRTSSSSVR